jgi:hypothetical protein
LTTKENYRNCKTADHLKNMPTTFVDAMKKNCPLPCVSDFLTNNITLIGMGRP